MSEFSNPAAFPISQVPDHVAGRPSMYTVRRWVGRGVRGARLRSWLVGGRRFTELEAIEEFLQQLNEPDAATLP